MGTFGKGEGWEVVQIQFYRFFQEPSAADGGNYIVKAVNRSEGV